MLAQPEAAFNSVNALGRFALSSKAAPALPGTFCSHGADRYGSYLLYFLPLGSCNVYSLPALESFYCPVINRPQVSVYVTYEFS